MSKVGVRAPFTAVKIKLSMAGVVYLVGNGSKPFTAFSPIIIETLFKFNLNVFYKIISYILIHLN